MDATQATELLRSKLGWRVGPHVAAYVAHRLDAKAVKPFPVMAADARTGLPVARPVEPDELRGDQPRLF
ncbi:MAG: hypothetical protein ACAI43_20255 [Phycisphaerae bacterium]